VGGAPSTTTWRGVRVCDCMTGPLNEAARLVTAHAKTAGVPDFYVTPIQGSYSTSTSASAGTHAGGGAIDITIKALSTAQENVLERTMREVGFASWNRQPSWYSAWFNKVIYGGWSAHNHSILNGCPHISPAAADQLAEYVRDENGLVGGDKDTGYRGFVGRTWSAYLAIRDGVVKIGQAVVNASRTSTANIAVALAGPIHMANLKVGKRDTPTSHDVSRYQAALWNRLPGSVRQEFIDRYGLTRRDLYDGIYGKVTAAMTSRLYVLIRLPAATEPGPKMMRHLGFTTIR